MAVDIKFLIDGADRGQPMNANEFGFTIAEATEINARIVSFNNELSFTAGVYDYLFSKLDETGFCNLINVEVQYLCSGFWKRLTNGYIILSECNFLIDICQVKTKIYDESFSTKINNNKGIPFSLSCTITKNLEPVIPPPILRGKFFNPADGSYGSDIFGNSVYGAFQHLVTCMSDGQIDFASNFFNFNSADSGDFLLITNGDAIRSRSIRETVVTFEKLYISLHNKFNLGLIFETQSNGRPLLRIELASYFNQQNPSVNLYDQPDINLIFDRQRLYSAVNFGSSPVLEKEECTGGVCTFTQTPFRGFRDETFGFTGECNTSTILNLKTNDIVFDTNVIEDVYRFNADDRKLDPFIVQCYWYASSQEYRASSFDPYSTGQNVYNGDFTNINVSANWINGYPNSLYSFLESNTFPYDPSFNVRTNFNIASLPSFPIQFTIFNSYFNETGNYINFTNEIVDPYNNFNLDKYVVPYAGVYTIRLGVILAGMGPSSSGEHEGYANLLHFSSNGILITSYEGTPFIQPSYNGFMIDVSATFIANAGDIIRGDVWCRARFANFGPQRIGNSLPIGGGQYTEMNGSAIPIAPNNPNEELQPVNIDDVRAYLYSFDRPLTITEIEAILNNTSRPISFGRWEDPLRVIEGYIKKVDVKSIIEQEASFELKSNKILR